MKTSQPGLFGWTVAAVARFMGFVLLSALAAASSDGVAMAADQAAPPKRQEGKPSAGRTTIGYAETVAIDPGHIRVVAEIDTGALSSSLDAADIETFRKEGKEWVRFTFRDAKDGAHKMAFPIFRTIHVRRADAPAEQRYVVRMRVCLGSYRLLTQVNLANRKGLRYRMLIGRRFMEGIFVVDPSARFLTRPSCPNR